MTHNLPIQDYAPLERAAMQFEHLPPDEADRRYRELLEADRRRGEQEQMPW